MMMDPAARVTINSSTQKHLLDGLRPGMRVLMWEPGLEVEATVEFDREHRVWLGKPDWSTSRDLPLPAKAIAP